MMLLVIRIYIYRGVEQCLFTPVFCFAITGCLPPLMPTWAESIGVLCTFLHHPIRSFTFLTRTHKCYQGHLCVHTHTHTKVDICTRWETIWIVFYHSRVRCSLLDTDLVCDEWIRGEKKRVRDEMRWNSTTRRSKWIESWWNWTLILSSSNPVDYEEIFPSHIFTAVLYDILNTVGSFLY